MLDEQLDRAILSERHPHAILLTGTEGAGKPERARRLAALHCFGRADTDRLEGSVCCVELNEESYSPPRDFREFLESLYMTDHNGENRAVIFNEADKMSVQSQNALLKTLEEPPKNMLFLLVGVENAMLTTVRSRCAVIRFGASPDGEIVSRLMEEGADRETARLAARLSDNVFTAAKLYIDPDCVKLRQEGAALLEDALKGIPPLSRASSLVAPPKKKKKADAGDDAANEEEEKKEETEQEDPEQEVPKRKKKGEGAKRAGFLLDVWESLLRDALLKRMGLAFTRNTDMETLTDRIAKSFTTEALQGMINKCSEARARFAFNVNAAQALDAALLGICAYRRK